MTDSLVFQLLADAVLTLHVALVLFVVGGLVLVLVGNLFGWRRVNGLWFRLAHLASIVFVAVQTALGFECPLTTLESWLRSKTDSDVYSGSFIEHWLQALLFWEAPPWVFMAAYSAFAFIVALAWWYFPPVGKMSGKARND